MYIKCSTTVSNGTTDTVWSWIQNYLLHRYSYQCVSIYYTSCFRCPPGYSLLGPLLFPVYINDMTSYIQRSQLLKFADDAKCFFTIATLADSNSLQEDITTLFGWSIDSDLNFNLKKFV